MAIIYILAKGKLITRYFASNKYLSDFNRTVFGLGCPLEGTLGVFFMPIYIKFVLTGMITNNQKENFKI